MSTTTSTTPASTTTDPDLAVVVLGIDAIGTVAESHGMRYYLTDCCGASVTGTADYVGCRSCYVQVPWELDDAAAAGQRLSGGALNVVYGDGLPYDEWMARFGPK